MARLLKADAENNAAIRLAYIHNMGDAYVSLSPVVAGLVTVVSGYSLFDPLIVVFTNVGFKRSLLSIVVIAPYCSRRMTAIVCRGTFPAQTNALAEGFCGQEVSFHRGPSLGQFCTRFRLREGRDGGRRMG